MHLTPTQLLDYLEAATTAARAASPTVPPHPIWCAQPHTTGFWLRSCFTHYGQYAALDVLQGRPALPVSWHILVYPNTGWPDVLAEGKLPHP